MNLETIGHATLLLSDDDGVPLLATDPWVLGSCYWRSWWLENEPTADAISAIAAAPFIYLSHEHPDHFHTPSLRRIGKGPLYLCPDFHRGRMQGWLGEHGFRHVTLPARTWCRLGDGIAVLSMPCIGEDSLLLVDTPQAVIIDINDARPTPLQLLAMRRWLDRHAAGKRRVVLSSYSSAGMAHSITRRGRPLEAVDPDMHVRLCTLLSRVLGADQFVPFASQAVYRRPDTEWANVHRVSYDHLREAWNAPGIEALPPYSAVDLASGKAKSGGSFHPAPPAVVRKKVEARLDEEREQRLDAGDLERLETKLRASGRTAFAALFPRGIVFDLGTEMVRYDTLRGRIRRRDDRGDFVLRTPVAALKEALATGHFSDLSIPMFTHVDLARLTPVWSIYLFFMLVLFHDIGWTGEGGGSLVTLRRALSGQLAALPPIGRGLDLTDQGYRSSSKRSRLTG